MSKESQQDNRMNTWTGSKILDEAFDQAMLSLERLEFVLDRDSKPHAKATVHSCLVYIDEIRDRLASNVLRPIDRRSSSR